MIGDKENIRTVLHANCIHDICFYMVSVLDDYAEPYHSKSESFNIREIFNESLRYVMIIIESKRKKRENILKKHPGAIIADVTSHAEDDLIKLSPFYPHGGIPVPFSEGVTATCVEAVWQGLKVFESADVDMNMFKNDTLKNIKRTVRKFGKPLGHRKGVKGTELLGYIEARQQIYIPTYRWVLENKVSSIIARLREASKTKTIVLLDYNANCDVDDPKKPLSHAFLIKAYVEGLCPYGDKKWEPQTIEPKQLSLF